MNDIDCIVCVKSIMQINIFLFDEGFAYWCKKSKLFWLVVHFDFDLLKLAPLMISLKVCIFHYDEWGGCQGVTMRPVVQVTGPVLHNLMFGRSTQSRRIIPVRLTRIWFAVWTLQSPPPPGGGKLAGAGGNIHTVHLQTNDDCLLFLTDWKVPRVASQGANCTLALALLPGHSAQHMQCP